MPLCVRSMALGLGMAPAEWGELRSKVDDSFWVMRIIGAPVALFNVLDSYPECSGYPPLPNDEDGFSCGAHKYVRYHQHSTLVALTLSRRDYGCLTWVRIACVLLRSSIYFQVPVR